MKYRNILKKGCLFIKNNLGVHHIQNKAQIIYTARYNVKHYFCKKYLKSIGTDIKLLEVYQKKYLDDKKEINANSEFLEQAKVGLRITDSE